MVAVHAAIASQEQYIKNQNILDDFEDITLSTNSRNPTIMDYDGFIGFANDSNGSKSYSVYINQKQVLLYVGGSTNYRSAQWCPVQKGDEIYTANSPALSYLRGRFYKLRDYTART